MNSQLQQEIEHGIRTIDEEESISIAEQLTILFDNWRTLAIIWLITIGLVGVYIVTKVPVYRGSGIIQVSAADEGGSDSVFDIMMGRPSLVETEVEILQSRRILQTAVKKLSLNIIQEIPTLTTNYAISLQGESPLGDDIKNLRRTVRDIEVAEWVKEPQEAEIWTRPKGTLEFHLLTKGGPQAIPAGGTYNQHGISFTLRDGPLPRLKKKASVTMLSTNQVVDNLKDALKVESIGRRDATNLVQIAFEHPDRELARDVVNAVMESYMEFSLNWKTLRADRSAVFVEKQLENIREELSQSEREIQGFLEKEGAVLLPEQAKELIRVSAELELEKRKVEIQEGVLNTVTNGLARRKHRKNPIALTSDFLVGDEVLIQSIGALNELVMKRETLLADVTEEHPQVIRMNEEIRRVRSKIEDSVKASLGRIKDRRESIDKGLESIQEKLKKFPGKERQLADLRRHLEVGQDMYKYLMTKLEEFRIMKASTTTDKRIIDRAVMPIRSVRPNRKMLMILAMVTGLLFGVAVIFARRTLDPRVQDEDEAKQLSRLPLYGAIPDLRMMKIINRGESVIDSVWHAPKGPAAESFRMIRTNIEFTSVDSKIPKVILATSSEAGEGKSTIIANLAVALSKAGNKVLLVDLDLRRPNQYLLFALPRAPGISDHLVGRAKLSIHHLASYELDVATSGNEPPESQRLLASKALSELIEKWCDEYDHVLLDTPPLLVADSLILSRLCDMMLFVVRPGQCRRSNLNLARTTYEKTEVIKGLVINGVGARRGGGYYHYYRGSYYGSKTSDTQEI